MLLEMQVLFKQGSVVEIQTEKALGKWKEKWSHIYNDKFVEIVQLQSPMRRNDA
jgi:hypothetical protein